MDWTSEAIYRYPASGGYGVLQTLAGYATVIRRKRMG
jgi:hypothetical protein